MRAFTSLALVAQSYVILFCFVLFRKRFDSNYSSSLRYLHVLSMSGTLKNF